MNFTKINDKKSFLIVIISIVQIAFDYLFFYIFMLIGGLKLSMFFSAVSIFCIFILPRIFILLGFAFFLLKKKIGWILLVFMNSVNIIVYGKEVIANLLVKHSVSSSQKLFLISHKITLFTSLIIFSLIFAKPVVDKYVISNKIKIYTLKTGLIISTVLIILNGI